MTGKKPREIPRFRHPEARDGPKENSYTYLGSSTAQNGATVVGSNYVGYWRGTVLVPWVSGMLPPESHRRPTGRGRVDGAEHDEPLRREA